jgi:adenylate cyclase
LRNAVFDGYQRMNPRERQAAPAVIVAIDERSIAALGQWPWPRDRLATLVERISAARPAAIALDILLPEPDRFSPGAIASELKGLAPDVSQRLKALPSNDTVFANAIKGHDVVLAIGGLETKAGSFPDPPTAAPVRIIAAHALELRSFAGHVQFLPEIDRAAAGRGLVSTDQPDRIVRHVPLVATVQGVIVPALPVEALRVATGKRLTVRDAGAFGLEVQVADGVAPAGSDGQAWVHFGPHEDARFLSAIDVLEGRFDADRLKGAVALLGVTGLGLLDYQATPLGERMPGVEVHAQVIENITEAALLRRFAISPRVESALLLACGILLVYFVPRRNALKSVSMLAAMVVVLGALGFAAFHFGGILVDPAWPALGAVLVFGIVQVGTLAEAERQRRQLREQAARMAGELDAARRIQMGLLPDPGEVFAAERRFEVAALLEPARTVGGDFYDCFMLDDRRVFFLVADVSGKGLPASLFMASVKSQIKSAALSVQGSVGGILAHAQDDIARENPESLFVTAFAAVLDAETGELELANAGHEPAYARIPKGTPERLDAPGGPPLCVMEMYSYPTSRRQLVKGEWLCVLSDGATEAQNGAREFFGSERLRTSLGWVGEDAHPHELIRRLRDDVHRFAGDAEPADDLTLLAIRWNGR